MGDNDGNDVSQEGKPCPTTSPPQIPAPPEPENDKGIFPSIKSPSLEGLEGLEGITSENVDVFKLEAVAALKLLCRSIDSLVQITGDIPPTPPARSRGSSPAKGLSKLREVTPGDVTTPKKENMGLRPPGSHVQEIDGVIFAKTPIGSPEAHASEPVSVSQIVGAHAQPTYIQHGALARKFYSKRPPPISTEDYLMRMHKYCPMSTAVYLASSLYITRLAIVDRVLPVTPRNVHRLLLACLRVAMKALEDLSWPHGRFSKVGGVTEGELGRLEITFCYLMDFSLKVDAAMLQREAESLCRHDRYDDVSQDIAISPMELRHPTEMERKGRPGAEKRKASNTLPSRPLVQVG